MRGEQSLEPALGAPVLLRLLSGAAMVLAIIAIVLSHSRGGFLGLADCYPCLRRDAPVAEAIEAAQSRKGPRF